MVSVDPTDWGPDFWKGTYGYADFEDFSAAAVPLLDGLGLGPLRPPTEVLARAAWYSPGSGLGIYVAGRLADDAVSGGQAGVKGWALAAMQALLRAQENEMPTLIIPNAFQVAITATSGGQDVVNVIGLTNPGGTAAGAAAAVKAAWEQTSAPLGRLSSLVVMQSYRAVDLRSEFGEIAEVSSSTPGSITTTNSLATNAACALITWNGSVRSRSTRGRLYFGPLMEAQLNPDGRTLVAATQTSMASGFNNFRASLNAAGYTLAVISRKNMAAYAVTTSACQSVIATQRRRIR